jgi:glycosyltransferase involved in cell wall biosynthesis
MSNGNGNLRGRVATLIPVFQAQKEFERTLESLRNSSIRTTIFVVDDGSLPPIEIPRDDPQLEMHLIRLPRNQGIVAALNAGITAAIGQGYEYIARIDAGDFAAPNRLALQVAWLDAHPRCMLVGCDAEVRNEDGSYCFTIQPPRNPALLARSLHERAWLLHPSVMFRASVFMEVGLYSSAYEAAEDYELFLRIAQKYEIGVVPEPLLIYVLHDGSISARKARVQAISRLRIQLNYFQWRSWLHFYGLFRTFCVLLMPGWAKHSLKMRFLYSRLPARPGTGEVSAPMELRTR